jgi:AcrR family transcriptional regulator
MNVMQLREDSGLSGGAGASESRAMLDSDRRLMAEGKKSALKGPKINEPKQDRSRASFERVLDAAVDVLKEKGYDGFTLQEVSRRSRVSIGSIYCRVDGKDDLFHAVQDHVLARIDAEVESMHDPKKWEHVEPQKMIVYLVREMAEHLRRNTPILRAFISREVVDPYIMQRGKAAHFRFLGRFVALLMRHAARFRHPDPEHAITFCFNLTFASLAKHLDLDTITPSNDGAQWNQLIDDLGRVVSLFLLSDPSSYASFPAPQAGRTAAAAAKN